jgi:hypothetical protein
MAAEKMHPSVADMRQRTIRAIVQLYRQDYHLLSSNSSERSVTHKLAEHLQREFPNWDVDCEYNRDGSFPKRMTMSCGEEIRPDDLEAKTVFPDIIVHHRGTKDNLLVIEVKKQPTSDQRDRNKLSQFTGDSFGYKLGAFLCIGLRGVSLVSYYEGQQAEDWSGELQSRLEGLEYGE